MKLNETLDLSVHTFLMVRLDNLIPTYQETWALACALLPPHKLQIPTQPASQHPLHQMTNPWKGSDDCCWPHPHNHGLDIDLLDVLTTLIQTSDFNHGNPTHANILGGNIFHGFYHQLPLKHNKM